MRPIKLMRRALLASGVIAPLLVLGTTGAFPAAATTGRPAGPPVAGHEVT
jgi:hypothetical protein